MCTFVFNSYIIIETKLAFAYLGNAGIWVQTHTIYYKPIREESSVTHKTSSSSSSSHSSRKGKGSGGKNVSRRKGDDLWTGKYYLLFLCHALVSRNSLFQKV